MLYSFQMYSRVIQLCIYMLSVLFQVLFPFWLLQNIKQSSPVLSPCCSFLFFKIFIYFWLFWIFVAAIGFSLVAGSRGYCLVVLHELLITAASLVAEHGV